MHAFYAFNGKWDVHMKSCLVVDNGVLNIKLVSRRPRFDSSICLEMMVVGFSLLY